MVAIRILQSLARFDECSLAITRAGAVDGLLGVLGSGGEPQCQAACYALGALAGAAEVGQAVLESGGLPVIVGLLDEGHLPETRAAAAEALGNLAYENYSESIVAAG